jgi:hypothetical protein
LALLIALRALNWAPPVERTCGAVELFKAKNNSTIQRCRRQQFNSASDVI